MNKQFFTKVSVLIDKLSFISNNNNFSDLNENDIDFKLLKNYSKELHELINSVPFLESQSYVKKESINTKSETSLPVMKPELSTPKNIDKKETTVKQTTAINDPEEEFQMKPITDNIFDTVNSIKQKSKIKRLNRLQIAENEKIEEENKITEPTEAIKDELTVSEPETEIIETPMPNINLNKTNEAPNKPSFIKTPEQVEIENEIVSEENDESLSLNDRFKQPTASLGDKIVGAGFKNLKELIDINDRFLFIQKLFGGSYMAFEEAVNQINKIDNYSEALDYIDYKIKSNFDWDSNGEEVAKFLNILEKKYN